MIKQYPNVSVQFIGGENIDWALDYDLQRAIDAIPDFVKLDNFVNSKIIYCVWPGGLKNYSLNQLKRKYF